MISKGYRGFMLDSFPVSSSFQDAGSNKRNDRASGKNWEILALLLILVGLDKSLKPGF